MMTEKLHHESIRKQFASRIDTYEAAAKWMLDEALIKAHREAAGPAMKGQNLALDLCCGTGIVGRNLLDLGWQVQGLDLTPEMGWVASQHFPVRIGSIERMEYEDARFDLAILRQSFMLVDGPRAMTEIARVLKPGGRFVLIQSVAFGPEDDAIYSQVQWARHINQKTYYRQIDLQNILRDHGLSIVGAKTLRVRESVDHWLNSAPELNPELRQHIRDLIAKAPDAYKWARDVREVGGELFEDWNWLILTGQKG